MLTKSRVLIVILSLALAACSAVDRAEFSAKYFWPDSAEEVADTHVAVTMVAPWEQYISALRTDFELDSDDALAQSIPRTASFVSKMIDAKTLQARVALQQKLVTKTVTHTDTEDTSTYQRNEKPGDPSAINLSTVDLSTLKAAGLPTIDTPPAALTDPSLHYQAAAGLLQQVALINRVVENAALEHNCRAYLVRMQASVMPKRMSLPYDTYVDIELKPKSADQDSRCTRIIPLLVTDEVTAASEQHAVDTLRQIEAGINFLTAGGSGDVTEKSLNDALLQGTGTRIGSVLMIGTPNGKMLEARIGAQKGPDSKFDMVARTYNVTAVMLTDAPAPSAAPASMLLDVKTRYNNLHTAKPLPEIGSQQLSLSFPRRGNFATSIGTQACTPDSNPIDATLLLDPKKPAQASMLNLYRDRATNLMAYMQIDALKIQADDIKPLNSFNKTMVFTFPSWTTYFAEDAKKAKESKSAKPPQSMFDLLEASQTVPRLCLVRRESAWESGESTPPPCSCVDLSLARKVAAEDPAAKSAEKPTSGASVTVGALIADAKGEGKLKVYVKPEVADKKTTPVRVALKGAEVNAVSDASNSVVAPDITPTGAGWKIGSSTTITFALSGLVPGSQLEVMASIGDKQLPSIKLPITALPAKSASGTDQAKP